MNIDFIVVKERKREWQRAMFTLANFVSLLALIVKVNENDIFTKPFAIGVIITIFIIFIYYIFVKI